MFNVTAELQEYKVEFEPSGKGQHLKVRCPFHHDNVPSATVHIETGRFNCFGCKHQTTFIGYLARATGKSGYDIHTYLVAKYGKSNNKTVPPQTIDRYCKDLPLCPYLKVIKDKGVSDQTLEDYRIGYRLDNERITIPIRDKYGFVGNVRKYHPTERPKFQNEHGFGTPRLFPINQLEYDKIIVCGGEFKALAALERLNQHGIGAVSTTGGEANWEFGFNEEFREKKVYVCYDIDEEGKQGAFNVGMHLHLTAAEVLIIDLPLDPEKYPQGDLNDYIQEGGDLLELLKIAKEFVPVLPALNLPKVTPEEIDFNQSIYADQIGKRLKTECVVSSIDTAPYNVPRTVKVTCNKSEKVCSACPIFLQKNIEFTIPDESDLVLSLVTAPKHVHPTILKSGFNIPSICKSVSFETLNYHSVEDTRVSSVLDISNRSTDRPMQSAYCVGETLELNETYEMVGRVYPHPKTQQSILLFSESQMTNDALSSYKCEDSERLKMFQPEEWTLAGLKKQLDAIYEDLEANVTHIYKRRNLHLAIDVAYHSPLLFEIEGVEKKAWAEVLIVGDSAQGKSETASNLLRHYQVGVKKECKGISVAGLLGGVQQSSDKRWFTTWGVIPTHDKRLVILEELKGARKETISSLTEMRSSGRAEITKIDKRSTMARTRLVGISNPRSPRTIDSYNTGVDVISELIGAPEDIRRFDFFLILERNEVDIGDLVLFRPQVEHVYTSELCRELVLWCWTRETNQIEFEDYPYLHKQAAELSKKFSDAIPIYDKSTCNLKLARFAAALAGRTFSSDDGETLIVRTCHVEYAWATLYKTYTTEHFGYDKFTESQRENEELLDIDAVERVIKESPQPKAFLVYLKKMNESSEKNIIYASGYDMENGRRTMSILISNGAIKPDRNCYVKTAAFQKYLKEVKLEEVPKFVEEF